MNIEWHTFETPSALADALAAAVAGELSAAVDARAGALLAVSGGTTPRLFMERLSEAPLDWEKVTVTLADERFVPPSSDRSNTKLAREHLLKNRAAAAIFVPLYSDAGDVGEAARLAASRISALPLPLDVVVLGMGTDGHTASFFPDAANIGDILAAEDGPAVLPVISGTAQEPRLTLSMPVISGARSVFLHIEGDDKKAVLERALAEEPPLPIRAVIERTAVPVRVYWAPKG